MPFLTWHHLAHCQSLGSASHDLQILPRHLTYYSFGLGYGACSISPPDSKSFAVQRASCGRSSPKQLPQATTTLRSRSPDLPAGLANLPDQLSLRRRPVSPARGAPSPFLVLRSRLANARGRKPNGRPVHIRGSFVRQTPW